MRKYKAPFNKTVLMYALPLQLVLGPVALIAAATGVAICKMLKD